MNFELETRNILNVFFDIFVSSEKATYDAGTVRKKIEHKPRPLAYYVKYAKVILHRSKYKQEKYHISICLAVGYRFRLLIGDDSVLTLSKILT